MLPGRGMLYKSGDLLGRYRLESAEERTRHGELWIARDTRPTLPVPWVSIWLEEHDDVALERAFLERARFLGQIPHPTMAAVLEAGTRPGHAWCAYELIEGATLEELFREHEKSGTAPPAEVRHFLESKLLELQTHLESNARRVGGVTLPPISADGVRIDPRGEPRVTNLIRTARGTTALAALEALDALRPTLGGGVSLSGTTRTAEVLNPHADDDAREALRRWSHGAEPLEDSITITRTLRAPARTRPRPWYFEPAALLALFLGVSTGAVVGLAGILGRQLRAREPTRTEALPVDRDTGVVLPPRVVLAKSATASILAPTSTLAEPLAEPEPKPDPSETPARAAQQPRPRRAPQPRATQAPGSTSKAEISALIRQLRTKDEQLALQFSVELSESDADDQGRLLQLRGRVRAALGVGP